MKTGRTIGAIVIAIASSGLVSTVAGTWLQDNLAQRSAYQNSRTELVRKLNDHFTGYRIYREKLYAMAKYESQLSEEQKAYEHFYQIRDEYLAKRNEYDHQLSADFYLAKHYFDQQTEVILDNYVKWDEAHKSDPVEQMVPDKVYAAWQSQIVGHMLKQLK